MIDFVTVETFKGASSTLAFELGEHPQITVPKLKAPYFYLAALDADLRGPEVFMRAYHDSSVLDRASFEALFPVDSGATLEGEAIPLYLFCLDHAIPAIQPDDLQARIVIILLNAADRALSNFNHNVKDGFEARSFAECIADWGSRDALPLHPYFHHVRAGLYNEQLAPWQAAFGQVLVVSNDDEDSRSYEVFNQIASFLGIEQGFTPEESIRLNKSGQPCSRLPYDFILKEKTVKRLLRPVYRALVGSRVTRKAISEQVKNLNLKSLVLPPPSTRQ